MVDFHLGQPWKSVLKNGEINLLWKMNFKDLKLQQNGWVSIYYEKGNEGKRSPHDKITSDANFEPADEKKDVEQAYKRLCKKEFLT